jgi:hypothetical protein
MTASLQNRRSIVRTVWYLATNFVGASVFLLIASRSWIEPELADIPGASGGQGIVWFLSIAPILLFFVSLNFTTLCWAIVSRFEHGQWPLSKLSWLSVPVWLCVVFLDNAHHGT